MAEPEGRFDPGYEAACASVPEQGTEERFAPGGPIESEVMISLANLLDRRPGPARSSCMLGTTRMSCDGLLPGRQALRQPDSGSRFWEQKKLLDTSGCLQNTSGLVIISPRCAGGKRPDAGLANAQRVNGPLLRKRALLWSSMEDTMTAASEMPSWTTSCPRWPAPSQGARASARTPCVLVGAHEGRGCSHQQRLDPAWRPVPASPSSRQEATESPERPASHARLRRKPSVR